MENSEELSLEEKEYSNEASKTISVKIPHFLPLAESGHSLEPDMAYGEFQYRWKPKIEEWKPPVPLNFYEMPIEGDVQFLGFRPEDSFELHETISQNAGYNFEVEPTVKKSYEIFNLNKPPSMSAPFKGMKPGLPEDSLVFDSEFESANLDKVVFISNVEYNLYLRPDSNSKGNCQWFYFKVSNTSKSREVIFNIMNLTKYEFLYTQGFSPSVYSSKYQARGWRRTVKDLKLTQSKNISTTGKVYSELKFSYNFERDEEVYIATCIPYTYSNLLGLLRELNKDFVKIETLCRSLSGIEVPVLTITDPDISSEKELVILTGRVHPGETNGSWVLEGLIKFLVGGSAEAEALRKKFLFKIVPMLNPDGVILGNSRCNLSGDDLNREFLNPNKRLHPTILHIKKLVQSLQKQFKQITYIDFHSHSKKKCSFAYGPYFPLHSENYAKIRLLPKLIAENSPMFRYYSCKFRSESNKKQTARLVLWNELKIPMSFTLETSYHCYINNERKNIILTLKNLSEIGISVALALLEQRVLKEEEKEINQTRKIQRMNVKHRRKKTPELVLAPVQKESNKVSINQELKEDRTEKRTLNSVLRAIKEEAKLFEDSDSGGSDSEESDNMEEHYLIQDYIISLQDKVYSICQNRVYSKHVLPTANKTPEPIRIPSHTKISVRKPQRSFSKLKERTETEEIEPSSNNSSFNIGERHLLVEEKIRVNKYEKILERSDSKIRIFHTPKKEWNYYNQRNIRRKELNQGKIGLKRSISPIKEQVWNRPEGNSHSNLKPFEPSSHPIKASRIQNLGVTKGMRSSPRFLRPIDYGSDKELMKKMKSVKLEKLLAKKTVEELMKNENLRTLESSARSFYNFNLM